MSERSTDQKFQDLMHGFDRMHRKSEERKAAFAELESLTVAGSSPDGRVSVTVTADGVLTDLRLDERLAGMRPAELAALVLTTYLSVQRDAAARATELAVTAQGEDRYLHRRMQWRKELAPQPAPQPAPRRRPVPEDEDIDVSSFFVRR
jgi:DNA-binding protein YbaB